MINEFIHVSKNVSTVDFNEFKVFGTKTIKKTLTK